MAIQSANAAEAALLAKKKAAREKAMDPRNWAQVTAGQYALPALEMGYKPLTGKATGQYVEPDKNMYNATGTDVARGVVGFLNKNLRDPLYRTFSTQNLQKAINPNTNETDRALAIAEDVMNVASVVPGVKALGGYIDDAVRYADDGVNALARAMSKYKNRNQFQSLFPERRILSTRGDAARMEQARLENRLFSDIQRTKVKPENEIFARPGSSVVDGPPEWYQSPGGGTERFWHTGQQGERLPEKLMPMTEAARIPSRRGSGSSQLLSGGLYATNSGKMSSTYANWGADEMALFPGSVLPDDIIYNQLSVPGIYAQNFKNFPNVTHADITDIRNMQIYDYLDQMVDLDSPIDNLPLVDNSFTKNKIKEGTWSGKTVREVLEEVETPEEALQIINDSIRPIRYKPAQKASRGDWDYAGYLAGQNERITFRHPIIKNPDGSYTRTAMLSPDTGLYLHGRESINARQPFSPEYYDRLNRLAEENWAATLEDVKNGFPDSSISEQIAIARNRTSGIESPALNIYASFAQNPAKPSFRRSMRNFPGQNYWDLPVRRNERGAIESIGDLKSIDIDSADQGAFDTLADNVDAFLRQEYPDQYDQYVQSLVSQIRRLPDTPGRTVNYSQLQNQIEAALRSPNANYDIELTPKERLYDYIQQQGYGVIPHSGGQVTGGEPHLAINILKPELLPPSNYIEGGMSNYEELLGNIARQKAIQLREVMSQGTGRELTGYLAQERMNKRLMDAARAARLAPLAGASRQATGNR